MLLILAQENQKVMTEYTEFEVNLGYNETLH